MSNRQGKSRLLLIIIILVVITAGAVHAQQFNFGSLDGKDHNYLYTSAGLDYALTAAEAGYGRVFHSNERPFIITAGGALSWSETDVPDFRIAAGAQTPVLNKDRWKIICKINPVVIRGVDTTISRMTHIGFDCGLAGGFYSSNWFCAAEAGADWALVNYIKYKDYYKKMLSPVLVDGRHSAASGNVTLGLLGGYSWQKSDLVFRLGYRQKLFFGMHMLPLYASVGIISRF
jgi:hypothetical protein